MRQFKSIVSLFVVSFIFPNIFAQDAVKLKTVRTEYGVFIDSKFNSIGNLDGAVINPDSVSILVTQMYIVNTSNDTFKGTDKFMQVMIFHPYSASGELLTEPDYNESNSYPFVNDLLPGDTTCFGTMVFRFSDIRYAVGESTWKQISYWKIITGISYTSVDGIYSDTVFFASADTCTFRITASGVGVADVTGNVAGCEVFPNPASEQLNVTCEEPMQSIALFNTAGQRVRQMESCGSEAQIPLSGLHRGLYLMKVHTANGSAVRKVVVEF